MLVVIGITLMADRLGFHIPKGYIYFAMAFSVGAEMLNMRIRRNAGNRTPPGDRLPAAPLNTSGQ